ncbi:MAG: hypothetical protein J6V91_03375 [Kiritimatiellae bacterium]|nr:hypothetical protein [Kiritimatiellia bacterium]
MIPQDNDFCKLIVTFDAIEAQNNEKHHSTAPYQTPFIEGREREKEAQKIKCTLFENEKG